MTDRFSNYPERELDEIVKQGKKFLDRLELERSFKGMGLTDKQAKIAARGDVRNLGYSKPSGGSREELIAALKRAHPDWTDRQIEIFINGK